MIRISSLVEETPPVDRAMADPGDYLDDDWSNVVGSRYTPAGSMPSYSFNLCGWATNSEG